MKQDKYVKLLLEQFDKADKATKENILAYVSGVVDATARLKQREKK